MVISGEELDCGYSIRDLHVHKASAPWINSHSQPRQQGLPSLWHKHINTALIRLAASVSAPHITPTFPLTLLLTLSDAAIGAGHCPFPVVTPTVTHSPMLSHWGHLEMHISSHVLFQTIAHGCGLVGAHAWKRCFVRHKEGPGSRLSRASEHGADPGRTSLRS